jgi:2-polyprenyl-3-methyl-5-hydroxy-6-metoxy-1,4-benzoquinol methylase
MDGWNGERQIGSVLEDIEEKHLERYYYAEKFSDNKNILDAACGCGYGSYILAKKAKKVLRADNSDEALQYADKHYKLPNIQSMKIDLEKEIQDIGLFDLIVSFETIEHLSPPLHVTIKKFYNLLNQGGILIISHPEMEKEPGHVISSEKDSFNIKKVLRALKKIIKTRLFNDKKEYSFHVHFNINGSEVKRIFESIGFEIIDEYFQEGRFSSPYHIVTGRKK